MDFDSIVTDDNMREILGYNILPNKVIYDRKRKAKASKKPESEGVALGEALETTSKKKKGVSPGKTSRAKASGASSVLKRPKLRGL
jgi:hypothetical protein